MAVVLRGSEDRQRQPVALQATVAIPTAMKHLNSQRADQEVMAEWGGRTVRTQCLLM